MLRTSKIIDLLYSRCMKVNALYISYDGMTDQLGQSQVLPYLTRLSQNGISFTLISFEKPGALKKNRVQIERIVAENSIEWIPLTYHKSPPVLSSVYDFFLMLRCARKMVKHKKIELIHCRSYLPAMVGRRLKLQYGVKFIFDMRGFWADERLEGKIWNQKNPVYRFLYKYFKQEEKKLLSDSDYIVTLTEKAKAIIHSWKLNTKQITVIPCCADTNHFNYENINTRELDDLRNKIKLEKDNLVIGYLGAIGTWYMLDEMLDFFKVMLTKYPNAKFLFVTNEHPKTILQKSSERNINENSVIIASSPRLKVPYYISLMHVSLFFIRPTFSKQASSPTKMAELLSMGVPIICNAGIGDDDIVIEQTGAGLLCHQLNESQYFKTVEQLHLLWQKNKADLRIVALEHYSLAMGAEHYNAVYKSVIK